MNQRTSLGRKIGYGLAIVVLLFVLSVLGAPATVDSEGGTLARLRTEADLSQSQLGEVDPASEAIKLATLGLRGVAVQFLWDRATHFKKVEDWTNLAATLEQLAKLQPNFITFWKYQGWNLAYNVSVEFDDYNDRYYWVRRGIQFLQQGNRYNQDSPVLLWEEGWSTGHKVGRADERIQYRRLFKEDDEFHPEDRPPAQRDNWLVSKEAYSKAITAVDEKGKSLGKKSESIFYSSAPKAQMNYAEAIEDEGLFDTAVAAWKQADQEWSEYGNVPIQHSQGPILRFNDEEFLTQEIDELTKRLKNLVPGIEQRVIESEYEKLSKQQKAALEIPEEQRTPTDTDYAYQAERLTEATPGRIALRIIEEAPELGREAKELAADISDKSRRLKFTQNYKDTIAYEYWKLRCEFEQTKAAVAARSLIFRAKRFYYEEADPFTARELYEESFEKWLEVFEQFPELRDGEGTTGDDVMEYIYEYNNVLEQLDEEIPDDFPLWFIIEDFDFENVFTNRIRERVQARLDEKASSKPQSSEAEKPVVEPNPTDSDSKDEESDEVEPTEEPAQDSTQPVNGDSSEPVEVSGEADSPQVEDQPSLPAEDESSAASLKEDADS